MARDDFDRRRLRALYERNRHRVSALADARDRRRGGEDEYAAPRRYIVSESRSRLEGFGRGGTQVRRVVSRPRGGVIQPRPMRFSDRAVFRRGGRDRFRRVEDFDREERRERFREDRRRALDRPIEGRRFGEARRMRLRLRGSRGGRSQQDGRGNRGMMEAVRQRGGDNRRRQQNTQQSMAKNRSGNQQRGQDQHTNSNRNGNQQRNQKGSTSSNKNRNDNHGGNQQRNKPQRSREPAMTREELDRQLDSYRN